MSTRVSSLPGRPNLLLGAYDLATLGYGAEEFFVSGTARSYATDDHADYTTRIVVCRPTDDAEFNGTVIVEWLNVSGGIDAPAVWFMAHREIARAGYAYVAVSAQHVGVEGGDNLMGADMSLKAQDPERYSPLVPSGRPVLLRHLLSGRSPDPRRCRRRPGAEIDSRGGGVAVGDVPDHLRQRGGS